MPAMRDEDTELTRETPKPISRTPRQRGSRAAWLATLASTAVCALPLLLAGGVAAGLGAAFRQWDIWATVALGVVGAGVLTWRLRTHTVGAVAPRGEAGDSCGPSC